MKLCLADNKKNSKEYLNQQGPSRVDSWKRFEVIAPRYDLFNRVASLGLAKRWRRQAAVLLSEKNHLKVLDLAAGTADQLIEVCKQNHEIEYAVGIDMSEKMLDIGRQKLRKENLKNTELVRADILDIPFESDFFDAATISFGIRNVKNIPAALKEILRVLKPEGRLIILEFSMPENRVLNFAYTLFLRMVLPFAGAVIAGYKQAYTYLSETIRTFASPEQMCCLLGGQGFGDIEAKSLCCGIVHIYSCEKTKEISC